MRREEVPSSPSAVNVWSPDRGACSLRGWGGAGASQREVRRMEAPAARQQQGQEWSKMWRCPLGRHG